MWYNLKEIFRINMKNKVITGLLGFLVVLGMATPALADEVKDAGNVYHNEKNQTIELRGEDPVVGTNDSQTSTTQLTTDNANSHYMVSIPAAARIQFNAVDTLIGNLQITGNIKDSKNVYVTVNGGNGNGSFTNKTDNNSHMAYNVTATANGALLTNFTANSAEAKSGKQTPLYVHIDRAQWDQATAGEYEGHITFNATLK